MNKVITVISLAAGVISAANAVSLYTTSFEPTTFTSGSTINNKGAWHTGSLNGSGGTVSGSSVVATNTKFHTGAQSALITAPSAVGGSFVYGYHALTYDATAAGTAPIITEEAYIWVAQQTFTSGDSGLADIEMDSTQGYALAEAGIDTGTGDLTLGAFGDPGTGGDDFFWTFSGGPVANFGAWNKVDLTLDYTASLTAPKVGASLNGVAVDTTGLSVYDFAVANGDVNSGVGFGDIQLYGGNTTSADSGNVTAYFDDFQANTVAAVPEPASYAVFGIGAIALLRRRRKA